MSRTFLCVGCVLGVGTGVARGDIASPGAWAGRTGVVGKGGGGGVGGGGGQRGDVIYDTLRFADEALYDNANGNAYSGLGIFGALYDLQLCDDFRTTERSVITQVTTDSLCFLGRTPAGGVQVDVYEDVNGHPPEDPLYSVTVPVAGSSSWFDPYFGLLGIRLTAEVHIPLAPNTSYYLMVQPVDKTSQGDWYYQIFDADSRIGGDRHIRDGGRANQGFPEDWTSGGDSGYGVGDIGMRIRAVPGAPGLVVLVGAGVLRRRGRAGG